MVAVLVVVVLSGCSSAASDATATATSSPPEPEAPATVVPTPTVAPVPTQSPTPDAPPDPTVVPDDLTDVDVEYMQAVVDVFAGNEGEIIREAVEHGEITPRMLELMDRAYGEDLRDRTVLQWEEALRRDPGLSQFADDPGDPILEVTQVWANADCVGLRLDIDRSATAAGSDLPVEETFMTFQSAGIAHSERWVATSRLVFNGRGEAGDPCG